MAWFILANGEIKDYLWLATLLEGHSLVCADGGANHAFRIDQRPEVVVGDMDSIEPGVKAWLGTQAVTLQQAPRAKDETDTRLALDWICTNHPEVKTIGILAGTGDRLDHMLANLQLLLTGYNKGIKMVLITESQQTFLVTPEWEACLTNVGREVSLLAVTPEVTGINTEKLAYPLQEGTLSFTNPIGISNVVEAEGARVTVRQGILLAVVTVSN